MSEAIHSLLLKLGEHFVGTLEEEDLLADLICMFEPYEGDPLDEVAERQQAFLAGCTHCGHEWPAAYFPAPVDKFARMVQRTCVCPKCFASGDIKVVLKS